MSMNALHLEQARRGARRVPRNMGWGDVHATLPPADRITLARWTRGVAVLYAALAILTVMAFAVHERANAPESQTAKLQRPHVN